MNRRELVLVGKIVKEVGLKGEVKVITETDTVEDFLSFEEFFVFLSPGGKKSLKILQYRHGGGRALIVQFEGIDTREKAELLKGHNLYVEEESLPKTKEGEFYIFELDGLEVVDEDGNKIGIVKKVERYPAQDMLFILTEKKEELMVPMVKEFIKRIEIERNRIVVSLPKGLDEI